jgi:thymidylate synthase (FAD)
LILIKPSFAILSYTEDALRLIERAGRTCYEMVRERGHLSVIEHVSLTVKFIVDRGFTHELVRHRLRRIPKSPPGTATTAPRSTAGSLHS